MSRNIFLLYNAAKYRRGTILHRVIEPFLTNTLGRYEDIDEDFEMLSLYTNFEGFKIPLKDEDKESDRALVGRFAKTSHIGLENLAPDVWYVKSLRRAEQNHPDY